MVKFNLLLKKIIHLIIFVSRLILQFMLYIKLNNNKLKY